MNTLYVISTQTAYGIAVRIIVANNIKEAMMMNEPITKTKSLIELGWLDYQILYSYPTNDTIGIKAEENS